TPVASLCPYTTLFRSVRDLALDQARLVRLQRVLLLLGHVPGVGVGDVLLQPHEQLPRLAYAEPDAHRSLVQDVDASVRPDDQDRSEEHTSELQSREKL